MKHESNFHVLRHTTLSHLFIVSTHWLKKTKCHGFKIRRCADNGGRCERDHGQVIIVGRLGSVSPGDPLDMVCPFHFGEGTYHVCFKSA